jgi:hypothetical protein
MVTRGQYPSCTACWVSEYAPEMSACEATTVAKVAMATMGYTHTPESRPKKGLSRTAVGAASRAAPWPR